MCGLRQYISFLFILNISSIVFALGTENFGDNPIELSPNWPNGLKTMTESPGLVYSRWVNGGEYFCYKGDVNAFNDALKKFADINAPAHRLIIEYGHGRTKSFDGKEIKFDWKLDVVGGVSRNILLRKDQTDANLSPKLTYYLWLDEGKLDALILPENIEVTVSDPNAKDFLSYRIKEALKWRTARRKWLEFVNPFLEKHRKRLKQTWPDGKEPPINGYVEFQSRYVSKYLPDYKIYVIETNIISVPELFAVSADGNVIDITGRHYVDKELSRKEPFSKFIVSRGILISDFNSAIEVGKFIEELIFAPQRWSYLRQNSNDFRIFKAWIFSCQGTVDDPNWQWYAEKQETGWMVSKRYVGPPASIIMPPKWNLVCDEKGQIIEVSH
ncbi:MAG: hypothetical protein WC496_01000 [Phycisphaerae bacterium]|jgi:hypothetical protein